MPSPVKPVKPGIKTTEFWITMVCMIIGFILESGVITEGSPAGVIAGAILQAAAAAGYAVSRGKAKSENGA